MSLRDLTLATALLALGAASAAAAEPEPAGTITAVEGEVTWHDRAARSFSPAHAGEKLFPGAVVRTGRGAQAVLRWHNGGEFKLFALGELTVPEDEGVGLDAGKVWAAFKAKLKVPFYFRSPSATAVVRGTILGVELLPDGATTVSVEEGRVEVFGARGQATRMLEPGQSILVSPFGGFGPVQPWSPSLAPVSAASRTAPGGGGPFGWLFGQRAALRLEPARRAERDARLQGPGYRLMAEDRRDRQEPGQPRSAEGDRRPEAGGRPEPGGMERRAEPDAGRGGQVFRQEAPGPERRPEGEPGVGGLRFDGEPDAGRGQGFRQEPPGLERRPDAEPGAIGGRFDGPVTDRKLDRLPGLETRRGNESPVLRADGPGRGQPIVAPDRNFPAGQPHMIMQPAQTQPQAQPAPPAACPVPPGAAEPPCPTPEPRR